jgi:predicted DCC family thiol-disulfide oxidoreductase YuxK
MVQADSRSDRVIIFDGECKLCSAWVDFVLRRDVGGSFRFAARQSAAAGSLLVRLGAKPDDLGSIALVVGHDVRTRSDAVLRIFKELPFPWKALCALLLVPRCLRDPVYSLVSRTRYRLFGRRTTCRLRDPDAHERFLP